MLPQKTPQGHPILRPHGDRTPIASLIRQEGAAHLLAVGTRPSPATLHLLAAIESQLAGGAR